MFLAGRYQRKCPSDSLIYVPTNLNAKTLHTSYQDMGGAHPFHSFVAKHIKLPAVQRLIDIRILGRHGSIRWGAIDVHLDVLEGISKS